MSKDTSKLEEILKSYVTYGHECGGIDDARLDTVLLPESLAKLKADLLAWHREEVALARADEIDQIISDGIFPEKYLLDREAEHRKQATNKSKEVER